MFASAKMLEALHPQNHFKVQAWIVFFFKRHYEALLPSDHSPRFGDGSPRCLFLWNFSSLVTFLLHPQRIPVLWRGSQSNLPDILDLKLQLLSSAFFQATNDGQASPRKHQLQLEFFWSGTFSLFLIISLPFLTTLPCL